MVKRGSKSRRADSAVDQLQAALTRSLKESVAETVNSVCGSFQHAVEEQMAAGSTDDGGGYDAYHNNCRRLVDYIQQNMEVSPSFTEQMDRIILACHSGASERVLNSVVTKQLWFYRRGDAPPHPTEKRIQTRNSRSRNSSSSGSGSGSGSGRAGSTRSAAKKKVKREFSASSQSPARMATRASTESPAMHMRSASGSKRVTRGSEQDAQPAKRPRRAARKVIHDTSDEEEEGEEEEKEMKSDSGRKGRKKQQQEEDEDELLSFKDAIGELCYPDRRTPTETKFFKERLRKSIQFVDALLCKPPQGKVCGRGCKKIRAQMCSSSTPCKNKMCRIWHDVEAHTDRCLNPQCEFKNRILLRETMHKLEMKEQQIAALKTEMEAKQAELKGAAGDGKDAVENDIAGLEHDLDDCDGELGVLEATKNTFWSNLNEIGIALSDDVVDNFPDFATHYEDKKEPRKARKAVAATTHISSATSRSSRAAARHPSAGPHGGDGEDEEEADDANGENVGDMHRRTARRSTSSGRHNAPPHHESDEETNGELEETKSGDEETHQYNPNDSPRPDEPPLPPAGPPPFRQNPELDREYAVSASGYSVHPPADDLEAPAVAANIELTKEVEPSAPNGLTDEQLADMQRASEEISGIMAGMSSNPPPVEPLNTTGISSNPPPVESLKMTGMSSNPPPAEPLNTTGFTIRGNQPQNP